jgi:acetyltransferase
VPTLTVKAPGAVSETAAALQPPFALKILSPDILHKSDVGGVVLDLPTPDAAGEAAKALAARIATVRPDARIDGIAIQSMIRRPRSHELLLGISEDRQFGPVILFGHGGIATEIIADRAVALPPLNEMLATDLVSRTRIHHLLSGYRDRPPADLTAITFALMKISQLAVDCPEVVELDINPLLADETGVMALDARIRIAKPAMPAEARLAIRPYPRDLEMAMTLRDGRAAISRPIRPEDAFALSEMFKGSAPGDLYFRFLEAFQEIPQDLAARLSQIDYDREMAFGIFLPRTTEQNASEAAMKAEMIGVVHLVMSPDRDSGEIAVIVRSDMKGRGIGYFMMQHIMAYAEAQGIREIHGQVRKDNFAMLKMSRELDFEIAQDCDDESLVRVTCLLGAHE